MLSTYFGSSQGAEAAFKATGQDLTEVIQSCIQSTHALILHRGAGACPAPAGSAASGAQGATPSHLLRRAGNVLGLVPLRSEVPGVL
jgi:hypothetical protein